MTNGDRTDWITLTQEEPVDPYRRIVDSHHHLHKPGSGKEPYFLEDLLTHTRSGHNVTHTVFVEAGTGFYNEGPEELGPVGETEFVAEEARRSDQYQTRVAAIIPFADLTLGARLNDVLDAHEMAGESRFRGVRYATTWDTSPEGLPVPKSNWANLIDEPPFVAYKVTCGITFTFGGVRITPTAQVVDHDGDPIPGLFAAGEMVGGLFYQNYPGGTGLTAGAVFGRRAGAAAAEASAGHRVVPAR